MLIRTIFLSTPDLTIHILVNYANINLLQALRMEFKHHSKVLFCHIWRKRSNLNEIRSHLVKIFGCRPGQKVVHDKLWQHANDNLCVLYCHLHLTLYQNQYLKWYWTTHNDCDAIVLFVINNINNFKRCSRMLINYRF